MSTRILDKHSHPRCIFTGSFDREYLLLTAQRELALKHLSLISFNLKLLYPLIIPEHQIFSIKSKSMNGFIEWHQLLSFLWVSFLNIDDTSFDTFLDMHELLLLVLGQYRWSVELLPQLVILGIWDLDCDISHIINWNFVVQVLSDEAADQGLLHSDDSLSKGNLLH